MPRVSNRYQTFIDSGIHTLLFPHITNDDAGRYTCRVTGDYGQVETSAVIEIVNPGLNRNGKPAMFLSRPDKMISVAQGEDIVVSCRINGDPKPKGMKIEKLC